MIELIHWHPAIARIRLAICLLVYPPPAVAFTQPRIPLYLKIVICHTPATVGVLSVGKSFYLTDLAFDRLR